MGINTDKPGQASHKQLSHEQLRVTLLSDTEQALDWLAAILTPVVEIHTHRLLFNGDSDPLTTLYQQHQQKPIDVFILRLGSQPKQQLEQFKPVISSLNTTLIVIGPADQPLLMRAAMRAGASDYLSEPFNDQELLSLLEAFFEIRQATNGANSGRITAFIPTSGGAGATFLACNLAHVMATEGHNTLLLDLNTRLGSAMQLMDLYGEYGLEDVLAELAGNDQTLDQAALAGYLSKHESGLSVLAMKQMNLLAEADPDTGQLLRLLKLLKQGQDEIIIDLPMLPVAISTFIQQQADRICLVMQQDMQSLRNTLRWLDLAQSQLGIARDRFTIVVNRYHRSLPIRLDDIRNTLKLTDIVTIPGDYARVSGSVNAGMPLLHHAPRASVTKAVVSLHTRFAETDEPTTGVKSLFKRIFR
ncbi:CpaE family protein [Endozoicomonas sp.]|uniref:AAA family ATPase n=1 Tax=Endozoicomonas sp. TaxID=1892382 RepID=UPI00383BD705